MPRLSKTDLFRAVSVTADLLKDIAGPDGRFAQTDVKKVVARKERAMASRQGVGATPSARPRAEDALHLSLSAPGCMSGTNPLPQ